MRSNRLLWFICHGICVVSVAAGQELASDLRGGFQRPAAKFRPLIITSSGPLTNPAALDFLEERHAGGAVLDAGVKPGTKDVGGEQFNNPTYLNDPEMLQRFRETFEDVRKRGMTAWIYDELGYPSGSAGGRVLEGHPEYQVWVVGSRTFSAGSDGNVTVEVSHPAVEACYAMRNTNGQLVPAGAVDLTEKARRGRFVWQAPAPDWVVCLFERYQPDSWRRHNVPRRIVNILDRAAIQRFITLTHETYAATLGPRLKDVGAFFTDEPQFGATEHWGGGLVDAPAAVQWTDELPAAFKRKYGYDVREALPAIFHAVGPKTSKYRQDFYDVQSDLVAANYFGQIQDWCHRHGTLSSGHLLLEESLLFHVMFSGSYWKNMARMDIPGVDLIGARLVACQTMGGWGVDSSEDFSNKFASSVSHLLRKPGTFTESFAVAEQATLREVLGVTSWQFAGGITHMSTYTIQDHLPPADYAAFADFAGRLAFFCRRGNPVADVAVMIPERAVWAAYNPPDGGRFQRYLARNPEVMKIDEAFRLTAHALACNQRDFEFLSEDVLQGASIENGRLAIADERFAFLVMPEVRMLQRKTLEKIRALVKAGGRVAFVGSLPCQTAETGDDPEIAREVQELMDSCPGQIMHVGTSGELPKVVGWMNDLVPPAVSWSGSNSIRVLHRHEPGREILLLSNPAKDRAEGKLTLPAAGGVFLWNPETGAVEALGLQKGGACVSLTVPGESAKVVTIEQR